MTGNAQLRYKVFIFFPVFALAILSGADRLRLEKAEKLENVVRKGVTVQILTGNVIFRKGEVIVHCDRAEFFQKSGQGFMTGKVVVNKKEQTLTCDSLHYDSPEDLLACFGNSRAWDPDYNLTADTLLYYTEIDSGIAAGSVHFLQKKQDIHSDRITYVKPEGQDAARYLVTGNVVIEEEGRTAFCGVAQYSPDPEMLDLRTEPKMVDSLRTLTGEQIHLDYADGEVHFLSIPARAHVTSQSSGYRQTTADSDSVAIRKNFSATDDMTGIQLKGFFKKGQLDSMRLEGMATTLYHIYDDSVYQGKNRSSGDTVIMRFADDNLENIALLGGSEGIYTPDTSGGDLEGPIKYSSDDIFYNLNTKQTHLLSSAKIHYTDTDLEAGYIRVDWDRNLLHAFPKVSTDSLAEELRPQLLEKGREPMEGDAMVYNLKTRRGKVSKGRTKEGDGYYHGKEIRNQGEKNLFVRTGQYSTCDLDEPHFYFGSTEMKLIQHDKVVARPLILYISGIPIIGLPFAVFPDRGGQRHSGWLMPAYGEDRIHGQYLNGLGYYWAINPYVDTKLTFMFADRQGIIMRLNTPYRKRYKYNGKFYYETKQRLSSGIRDITQLGKNRKSDYVLRWNHQQKMRHNQSFNANVSYYSNGEYNRLNSTNLEQRLNQKAVSNISYSRSWPKSKNSIGLNLSSNRDLMAEQRVDSTSVFYQKPNGANSIVTQETQTLPNLTFRHGQSSFFQKIGGPFKNAVWNYNVSFNNNVKKYYQTELDTSNSLYYWENTGSGSPRLYSQQRPLATHNASLSSPTKIFKYITVNPQLSFQSVWVDQSFSATVDTAGNLVRHEVPGLAALTTGRASLQTNTQIYGLFPIRIGRLSAIRHVMSPSLSLSYTPDFSKPLFGYDFGYVEQLTDPNGEKLTHDRFSGTRARGTPSTESKSLGMSLNNVFQAKVREGDKDKKINLFSWQMSSNYNFVAKDHPLANLRSSIRTTLAKGLSLDLGMTHDFYAWDYANSKRSDNYNRNSNGTIVPRLLNASMSTSFHFNGKRLSGEVNSDTTTTSSDTTQSDNYSPFQYNSSLSEAAQPIEGGKFWSANLGFQYSINNSNPSQPSKTFWMNTSSSIQLTQSWSVKYNARFDLVNRSVVSQSFSIHRDLHCWEMAVTWTPGGYGRGFNLLIRVKSPTLKDLKIEQKGGTYNRLGY